MRWPTDDEIRVPSVSGGLEIVKAEFDLASEASGEARTLMLKR